jgi:hypothetical protein
MHKHQDDRRREERVIDLLPRDQVQDEIGRDVADHCRAGAARHGDQPDVEPGDMKERHRREHLIPGLVLQAGRSAREVEHGEIVAVGQPDPLGQAGGA